MRLPLIIADLKGNLESAVPSSKPQSDHPDEPTSAPVIPMAHVISSLPSAPWYPSMLLHWRANFSREPSPILWGAVSRVDPCAGVDPIRHGRTLNQRRIAFRLPLFLAEIARTYWLCMLDKVAYTRPNPSTAKDECPERTYSNLITSLHNLAAPVRTVFDSASLSQSPSPPFPHSCNPEFRYPRSRSPRSEFRSGSRGKRPSTFLAFVTEGIIGQNANPTFLLPG
ncbi:hypothetical protein F5Y13DRAFT_197946 [Hypoxylon sp. FL1857]|nr:hypothetical protein F5Y13DRAFT_197946 [Hypoxylon sp. FL1857]